MYYCEQQPGNSYTLDHWMQTTIATLWHFAMTLWCQRNLDKHSKDSAITIEKQCKEAMTRARAVYNETLGNVSWTDSHALHHVQVHVILNWTKQHLDVYLKTAEVVCEQNVEPG